MSRTKAHNPKTKVVHGKKHKRTNNLGICNCPHCKQGRRGTKDGTIMRIKRRLRQWWNNKPEIRGAYTD